MTKKLLPPVLTIFILLTLFHLSCVNNNELDLYGVQECDTTNISWNSKISAILEKNCVICHNDQLSYNGVRTDNYNSVLVVVTNGRLFGVVNHLSGYPQMPKDRGKLPDCELEQINLWLNNGAPEN